MFQLRQLSMWHGAVRTSKPSAARSLIDTLSYSDNTGRSDCSPTSSEADLGAVVHIQCILSTEIGIAQWLGQ